MESDKYKAGLGSRISSVTGSLGRDWCPRSWISIARDIENRSFATECCFGSMALFCVNHGHTQYIHRFTYLWFFAPHTCHCLSSLNSGANYFLYHHLLTMLIFLPSRIFLALIIYSFAAFCKTLEEECEHPFSNRGPLRNGKAIWVPRFPLGSTAFYFSIQSAQKHALGSQFCSEFGTQSLSGWRTTEVSVQIR